MEALKKGSIYFIDEERLQAAIEIFLREVEDKRGLVLTRVPLYQLDREEELSRYDHYRIGMESRIYKTISPHRIPDLIRTITDFVEKKEKGIILLEGLEYLMIQNNLPTIIRLLQFLFDRIAVSRSILLISINPLALDIKDLHLLKSEASRLPESVETGIESMAGTQKARS